MEITLILNGECPRCGREKVERSQWTSLPWDVRVNMKSAFAADGGGRNLCKSCDSWIRKSNPDELLDYERKTMQLSIFAEEYIVFKQSGMTDQHIAEKLGLFRDTKRWPSDRMSTFNKALERAKKAGLL